MARKILATGNWITVWYDHDVPFWGKPPLSFWTSAVTMYLFGVNEFAARLAPFLASIVCGLLFFAWPFKERKTEKALACFIIMQTTVIGFVASGAVMTDEFLFLGTTLCMVSFWKTMTQDKTHIVWKYLFFAGLAIGLLAKGPLVFVLVGFPVFFWTLIRREWRSLWCKLPWLSGILLMLAISAPWYWAAENATPGFLRYFIIGEHFERFLVKGWEGDLYGSGHARTLATIWVYALECTLPWVLLVPAAIWKKLYKRDFNENLYLVLWMLGPLVFFTPAKNILPAYVLPMLAAFCIFTCEIIFSWQLKTPKLRYVWAGVVALMIILALAVISPPLNARLQANSHKQLLSENWDGESALIYIGSRKYSADFYTLGRAKTLDDFTATDIEAVLRSEDRLTLVMKKRIYEDLFAGKPGWRVTATQNKWYMLTNFNVDTHTSRMMSPGKAKVCKLQLWPMPLPAAGLP